MTFPDEVLAGLESSDLHYRVTIGLLQVDLALPLCQSLKAKRGILSKTKNHIRKKHSVSVAEVAHQDTWGRAGLAIVAVNGEKSMVEAVLAEVVKSLQRDREVELVHYAIELL